MIHSVSGLSQYSKKPPEKPAIQPVFGSGKITFRLPAAGREFLQLCPKKGILTVRRKKNPIGLESGKTGMFRINIESCVQH